MYVSDDQIVATFTIWGYACWERQMNAHFIETFLMSFSDLQLVQLLLHEPHLQALRLPNQIHPRDGAWKASNVVARFILLASRPNQVTSSTKHGTMFDCRLQNG
jgi:hypothetical protein